MLFETAVPVVVFQFDGSSRHIAPQQANESTAPENGDAKAAKVESNDAVPVENLEQSIINKSIEKVANVAYFDKLNSWLGQNLQRDCPDISFEIREHLIYGTCIRFCPLELGLADTVPSIEQLEELLECFESQIDILRATVKHKATLNRLVEQSSVLRLVPLHDW